MKVSISCDMTPDATYSDKRTCVPEKPATPVIRLDTAVLLTTDVRNSKKKCISQYSWSKEILYTSHNNQTDAQVAIADTLSNHYMSSTFHLSPALTLMVKNP